ncbi:MAG: alpha,2-mannosyltransferase [Actinomycetota bacterium]|nr:alpha,2-mannosyltransferase [Actinomycetota bacterium]
MCAALNGDKSSCSNDNHWVETDPTFQPPPQVAQVSPVRRRGLEVVVLLLLLLAFRTLAMSWADAKDQHPSTDDFTADYVSARAFDHGANAYGELLPLARRYLDSRQGVSSFIGDVNRRNPHPPAYLLMVAPLAELPYAFARNIWLILMAISVASAMGIVAITSGASRMTAAAVALGSLALPPVVFDLKLGGADVLVLLAVVIAWQQIGKGREVFAGVALGAASALKLYPLFLVIPLLRRRNVKAVFAQVSTTAIVTAVAGLALGFSTTVHFLSKAMPANTRYWLTDPHNFALVAVPFRWLTRSNWNIGSVDAPLLANTLAVGLVILCLAAALATPARQSEDLLWATTPWMLLISPLFWYQYTVLVLPLIYLILRNHFIRRSVPQWPVALAIGLLLMWTLESSPPGTHHSVLDLALVFALPAYGVIILGLSEWGRSPKDLQAMSELAAEASAS